MEILVPLGYLRLWEDFQNSYASIDTHTLSPEEYLET